MKKMLMLLAITLPVFIACNQADKKAEISSAERDKQVIDSLKQLENQKAMLDTANYTTIAWLDSTFIKLPKAKEGEPVNVSFRFKNTGTKPLVIANVTAGCGCTVPEKPEEPIAPGEEGVIKAAFDSKHKKGNNRKSIFVDANTKPSRGHDLSFEIDIE